MGRMVKFVNGSMIEYEIFKLVDFYDPILRKPTEPFDFNAPDATREAEILAYSLAETCGKLEGLGLSANQCGINKRVCVINMGESLWTLFNPYIIKRSYLTAGLNEGCLSYPGLFIKVPERAQTITIRFQAIGGQFVEKELHGLTAVCAQHEIDHLDGIMYTDKISKLKLDQAKTKVKQNLKKMSRVTVEQAEKAALAMQKMGVA